MRSIDGLWLNLIGEILTAGTESAPRGQRTKELTPYLVAYDARTPVLLHPGRKLSYKYLAAEAWWILSGKDDVASIAPYNKRITEFSDDGEKFFGAYGPKILEQLPYVVERLTVDPATRQAGINIWRESPKPTRDVPCTVAFFFRRRDVFLDGHVFMRSSDAWLGFPYDVFTFSMVVHRVAAELNVLNLKEPTTIPGRVYLTMASSHLYETNFDAARFCFEDQTTFDQPQEATPPELYCHPSLQLAVLKNLRDVPNDDPARWWNR